MSDAPSDAPAGVISAVLDLLLATKLLCAAGAVAALRALASVFLLLLPLGYMLLSCSPLTECASAAGADVVWRVTADAVTLLLLLLLPLLSLLVVLSGRAVTRKRLTVA
jgi:hypothetical protein